MKRGKRLLLGFGLFLAFVSQAVPQSWDAVLGEASAAVVNVQSRMCGGSGDRSATGFVWRDTATVVTALHVVADCRNLSINYELHAQDKVVSRAVRVIKVLPRADLVLLAVDNPLQVKPLVVDAASRPVGTSLQVLGYPLQQPRMLSTSLSVRFGSSKLGDLLGPLASQFSKTSAPAVDLKITNIEGHLLPGLSGAPILDAKGRVIAIGDGGLTSGTAGINWAVPVDNISELAVSNIVSANNISQSRPELFAAEAESKLRGRVTCGRYPLTWVRSTSLKEVAQTNDDLPGLQKLVNQLGVDPDEIRFDLYQHLGSGATVVVPAGTELKSGSEACTAVMMGGKFRISVQLATVTEQTMQPESVEMEKHDIGPLEGWQLDQAFTYAFPMVRPADHLMVRRVGMLHLNPRLLAVNSIPQDEYLFEAVAWRGTMLVHVSTLNTEATVEFNKGAMLCHFQPTGEGCDETNAAFKYWASSVLGVHLTTFAIG